MSRTIYHIHHIIPRHMGGSNDPSNLKTVTIPEHAEEHRLLYEEHGHWQDYVAWKCLSGQISNAEAVIQSVKHANTGKKWTKEQHEHAKIERRARWDNKEYRERCSKNRTGAKNHMFGRTHTEEAKEKISKRHKGKIISEEHRKAASAATIERNTGSKWWVNPDGIRKQSKVCPGDGYVLGWYWKAS